jgi:hypothetical protein
MPHKNNPKKGGVCDEDKQDQDERINDLQMQGVVLV